LARTVIADVSLGSYASQHRMLQQSKYRNCLPPTSEDRSARVRSISYLGDVLSSSPESPLGSFRTAILEYPLWLSRKDFVGAVASDAAVADGGEEDLDRIDPAFAEPGEDGDVGDPAVAFRGPSGRLSELFWLDGLPVGPALDFGPSDASEPLLWLSDALLSLSGELL